MSKDKPLPSPPKSQAPALAAGDLKWIFETASLARAFEDRIGSLSKEGFCPPTLHPGAGQEVAQLTALRALRDSDPLLYSHRGTAYMIGRGISLAAMLADLAGRNGGTNNGKGGIMHVVDVARGVYGESGTLGGGMVIATGMGIAVKKKRLPHVIVHFFGDGASNRGTFHESLNWSAVLKLPILFICENNGWAVSVPTSASTSVKDIADRGAGYGIPGIVVDGLEVEAVHDAVSRAAERARSGGGPTLIEIKTVRLRGHYVTDPQDYRRDAQLVLQYDPLTILGEQLKAEGILDDPDREAMNRQIMSIVDDAVSQVKAADPIAGINAYSDIFA